jgi:3-(methylthio)propionyl---CoA ligase
MLGMMMQQPLLVSSILRFAARYHCDSEIVSRRCEGDIHRYDYGAMYGRTCQLAHALARLGVRPGDRVSTLAWNTYRHLELYYAVSGQGAIIHTINPRLFPEQIAYIANHAESRVVFFDLTFAPLVAALASKLTHVRAFVAMTDRAHMPAIDVPNLLCYEELLATEAGDFEWPVFDENTAAGLCYTSGTTGNPKGVLYSHRSTLLHAYALALPDAVNLSARDVVLPVVPMFHVNAWGIPYACPAVGCKLVMPGPGMDGHSLYQLFEAEGVTMSAGVPTVWLGLLNHVQSNHLKFSTFKRTVIGGSACPPAMIETFEKQYGVEVLHAWGMTEMSPLGTVNSFKPKHQAQAPATQRALKAKQGRPLFGVDLKIVDAEGGELPRDGKAFGDLLVRGPWVTAGYYKGEGGNEAHVDGWFRTGDVATLDADGFMQITDRSKDVIKSGGEWISSIDLENLAMAHPAVAEAAVIGVPHPKWDERPLVLAVLRPGAALTRAQLLEHFDGKVAKWWMPDDVVFVDKLPHTATGKLLKTALREAYKGHVLPTA